MNVYLISANDVCSYNFFVYFSSLHDRHVMENESIDLYLYTLRLGNDRQNSVPNFHSFKI